MDKHCHHSSGRRWVFWVFLTIAGFFLWTEHKAHLLGVLPYLFLLACPLMHLFHGHGHGHHADHNEQTRRPARDDGTTSAEDDATSRHHKHD